MALDPNKTTSIQFSGSWNLERVKSFTETSISFPGGGTFINILTFPSQSPPPRFFIQYKYGSKWYNFGSASYTTGNIGMQSRINSTNIQGASQSAVTLPVRIYLMMNDMDDTQ